MSDDDLIPAATVVLLRDGADGPETLMLRRNSKIAFGGMWVFPGGRVDDHELGLGDAQESARVAASREAAEEAGLAVDPGDLVPWSLWIPPLSAAVKSVGRFRRFSTWFFVAETPGGEVMIDGGEIHEHRWLSPLDAMTMRDRGDIELLPPTWVTLWQIRHHRSVADVLANANAQPEEFRTRPINNEPLTLAWAGDVAHDGGPHDVTGPRHRLVMDPSGWSYERDR